MRQTHLAAGPALTRLASFALIAALGACQTGARPGILRVVDGRPLLTPEADADAYRHFLRGELLLHRGDAKAAIGELGQALRADPASPYIRARLAAALASQRRYAAALAQTEEALRRRPGFAEALLVAAAVHRRQGQPGRAEEALRECIDNNPRQPAAYLALAALLERRAAHDPRRAGAARSVLEALTRALPDDARGHDRVALLCLRTLDYRCAAAAAARAATLSGEVSALLRLAHARRGLGQLAAAVLALREAFDRSGGHAGVAFPLAEALAEQGAGDAVDDLVDLMVRQGYGERAARAVAAELALRGKRPAKALAVLDGAAQSAKDAALRLLRARALDELGRRDEAERLLVALAQERDSGAGPMAAVQLATILQRAGDGKAAVRTLRDARALHGHDEALVLALARVLQRQGMEAAAVDELRHAVAESGGQPLELGLALALERAGRWREALALMERAADKRPESAPALNFVGYCLADHGVQLERAERAVRRALFLSPEEAYIVDSVGWVLHRAGRRAEAEQALSIAVRLAPEEPEILGHLAEVRAALRRVPDAIRLLKRALAVSEDPTLSKRLRGHLERLTRAQVGRSEGHPR